MTGPRDANTSLNFQLGESGENMHPEAEPSWGPAFVDDFGANGMQLSPLAASTIRRYQ
jgi:hypothetical protein